MAARPRKQGRKDWPQRLRAVRRGKLTHYYWEDPRSGKRESLKCPGDLKTARKRAVRLNDLLAEQATANIELPNQVSVTVAEHCNRYTDVLLPRRTLAPSSADNFGRITKRLTKAFGDLPIEEITTKDLAGILDEYVDAGKLRMAQVFRSTCIDIFREAVQDGERDDNPALNLRPIKGIKTTRERLTIEQFDAILEHTVQPWSRNAMLLALITGQRMSDLATLKFRDAHNGFLWVVQGKTGMKVRLPLALTVAGYRLEDVIAGCRDRVLSPYLLHHVRHQARAKPGDRLYEKSLSRAFRESRKRAGIEGNKPPSFHEIRSLSARLHTAAGHNAQAILGHKTSRMADMYQDVRGAEWITVTAS